MTIYIYIPIDKNTKAADYYHPNIENTKESLVAAISVLPPQEEDEDNNNNYYGNNNDPFEKILKEVHKDWIEIMSFSHNVAHQGSGDGGSHFGEFTITKFICELSPVMNYFCLKNEYIPKVIFRAQVTKKKGIINVVEYEFDAVCITNQSVSGGAGGKPVETLSLKPTTCIHKMYDIDAASGEFISKKMSYYNLDSKKGSRSIISQDKIVDDIAKDHILQDSEPEKVKLLKEMGLITSFDYTPVTEYNYYRIMVSSTPLIFKKIDIPRPKTRKVLIENTAKAIGKQVSDIQAIFSGNTNTEIEIDEDLDELTNLSNVFVKIDDKYVGVA